MNGGHYQQRWLPRDSPLSTSAMAKDLLERVSWQGCYQGRTEYSAICETEVLLISQDDSLLVADAVPRRSCELTKDDKQKLERLNISPDSQYDDASIMAARYALDKRFTNTRVERSEPGSQLSKSRVLQMIRDTMKTSTKLKGKQNCTSRV